MHIVTLHTFALDFFVFLGVFLGSTLLLFLLGVNLSRATSSLEPSAEEFVFELPFSSDIVTGFRSLAVVAAFVFSSSCPLCNLS